MTDGLMYIAVIEPCKYTGGAYWVNSRRHILVQAPRNQGRLAAELRLAGVSHAIAAAIRLIRDQRHRAALNRLMRIAA